MLWESLYAVTLAPSYLNRQAYGMLLRDGSVTLISKPDEFNTPIDGDLSLGIALLHFTVVAEDKGAKLHWHFDNDSDTFNLPAGHRVIATSSL